MRCQRKCVANVSASQIYIQNKRGKSMNEQNFNEVKRLSRLIWLVLNNKEKAHYLNDVGIIALIEKAAAIVELDLNRDGITAYQLDDIIKTLTILNDFHKSKS